VLKSVCIQNGFGKMHGSAGATLSADVTQNDAQKRSIFAACELRQKRKVAMEGDTLAETTARFL